MTLSVASYRRVLYAYNQWTDAWMLGLEWFKTFARSAADPSITYVASATSSTLYLSLSDLGISPTTGRRLQAQLQRKLLKVS